MKKPQAFKPLPAEKENLHPRNAHRSKYNFAELIQASPNLRDFVKLNQYQNESIDFSDPEAVKALNKALLKRFYDVEGWEIPEGYLCPPIPGRADYIHYLADLLALSNDGRIPTGSKVNVLDVGVGANCVYPLIGHSVYGWGFVGSDIDPVAIQSAQNILSANPKIGDAIEWRLQTKGTQVFAGMVKPDEYFDLTMCNPPFHSSWQEAQAGNLKKRINLHGDKATALLNFGGKTNELWCVGGEAAFISHMVHQSMAVGKQCLWFTTLVSKKDTLEGIYKALVRAKAVDVKTIGMAQGQKVSRMVAWTFLSEAEQQEWKARRWLLA